VVLQDDNRLLYRFYGASLIEYRGKNERSERRHEAAIIGVLYCSVCALGYVLYCALVPIFYYMRGGDIHTDIQAYRHT